MTIDATSAVGTALRDLFQHLGIERAHIAAGQLVLADWYGLATVHPERVGSLILVAPSPIDPAVLQTFGSRLLVLTGELGGAAENTRQLLTTLPQATGHILRDYTTLPWSDLMTDRGAEIGPAILDFLDRVSQSDPIAPAPLPEQQGESANISYHIRGAGPPLVLMPLDLTPSQWEPLIPLLSTRYCTITLGGPTLGAVSILEGRGQSSYLGVVRALLDVVRVQPGEVILEVGPGSGVVLRELARRTTGANRLIGVDINPYLLREAAALTKREGLADMVTFQEGSAEALPLAANSVDVALSCTVMEEGDADRMLAELVRVTRPGGRVAAIVRATDMPSWANLQLSAALRLKADQPGLIGRGMSAGGCADASLYRRFHAAGLKELTFFPQFAAVTPTALPGMLVAWAQRILGLLTPDEAAEWNNAAAQADADGTFFIASSHHCAVGRKPV